MQHYTREIHKAREEGLSCMIQMLGGAGCLASRVCFGLRGSVLESATHGHWLKISHINMYTSLQNKGDSKSSAVHTSVTSVHVLKLLGQNPGLSRPSLADFVLTNRERFVFRLRCQSQVPQRRRHVDKKSKAAVPCLFSEESPEIKLHQTLVNPIELNIQEPSNILEGDVRIGGIHRSTSKSPPFRGRSTESRPTAAPDVDLRSRPARARARTSGVSAVKRRSEKAWFCCDGRCRISNLEHRNWRIGRVEGAGFCLLSFTVLGPWNLEQIGSSKTQSIVKLSRMALL